MCNLEFTFGKYHLPEFKVPDGYTSLTYFKKLCADGFAGRYGEGTEKQKAQLEYEENMIEKMGFVDYFLIVSDFVRYAKSVGIPVGPGRGSAAGIFPVFSIAPGYWAKSASISSVERR